VVWSYSLADPEIRERFEATDWIWRRDAIEPLAQRLAQNQIVTFSTYVWNHRYNYALARRIKEINPAVTIIFGGPEPAIEDPLLFEKEPFMDLVSKMEGEITFKRILEDFDTDFSHIPGLLINTPTGLVNTGDCARIDDLDQMTKVHKPDVLFCAITNANSSMPIQVYINTITRKWPNTTICLTGSQVTKRKDLKTPTNCKIFANPDDFIEFISKLNN
jgi:radical SAM superfamily enzyme YgiQ (UPF0313 family)